MSRQPSPSGIGLDRWRQLCSSLRVARVADNEIVYRQGEPCREIFLIARGHIKLSRLNAQGEAHTVAILPRDELCGAPLSGHCSLTAADTASAKGATLLYRLAHAEFVSALYRDPRAASFVVERLAKRQTFLTGRIEQLLNGNVGMRIAAILAQLTSTYGGRCAHGHEVDIRLTQQELAEMAGASRPTVSTMLNQLRRQNIVGYTRQYICIENRRALEAIANANDATAGSSSIANPAPHFDPR